MVNRTTVSLSRLISKTSSYNKLITHSNTYCQLYYTINKVSKYCTNKTIYYNTMSAQQQQTNGVHTTSQQNGYVNQLRVALLQVHVGNDKNENIQNAIEKINESVKNNANVVILPEMFNCPYSNSSFPSYSEPINYDGTSIVDIDSIDTTKSPTIKAISQAAKQHNIYIIGGSIPECENDKLYNTSVVFNNNGQLIAKHRKVHLFDIDVPGKIRFKESDSLTAGNRITTFDTPCMYTYMIT